MLVHCLVSLNLIFIYMYFNGFYESLMCAMYIMSMEKQVVEPDNIEKPERRALLASVG